MSDKRLLTQIVRLIPLSEKQQLLLGMLSENDFDSASQFVLECPIAASTAWHNLRALRSMRLVEFGDGGITLTRVGRIVAMGYGLRKGKRDEEIALELNMEILGT